VSAEGEIAVESVEKEVKRIKKKFFKLTREDKAGRVFVVIGLILISFGMISLGLTFNFVKNAFFIFLFGFISTTILITGYSLMHKSLRGAWL
jgi:hypothetical protein